MKLDLLPKPWKSKPKRRPHPSQKAEFSSTTPSEPATPNDAGEAASKKKSANAIIVSDDDSDDFEILGNGEKKAKLSGDTKITAENFQEMTLKAFQEVFCEKDKNGNSSSEYKMTFYNVPLNKGDNTNEKG